MTIPMNHKVDVTSVFVEAIRKDNIRLFDDEICPGVVLDQARRNRLAGFIGQRLQFGDVGTKWNDALASMARTYQANLLNALKGIQVAKTLLAAMELAGIPCLGLRGPFAGAGLYGDPALRVFSDIDILVPAEKRKDALVAANKAGFRLAETLHAGFFERHHLHWRLEHESGMPVELHWAVEHPLSLRKIAHGSLFRSAVRRSSPEFTWLEPMPEHLLILMCLHTVKHCRGAQEFAAQLEFEKRALTVGCLHYWVDIVMLLRRYGSKLNWSMIVDEAGKWNAMDAIRAGVGGAAQLDPGLVTKETIEALGLQTVETSSPPVPVSSGKCCGLLDRLAAPGRFRGSCFADSVSTIFPPVSYFGDRHGIRLIAKQIAHACLSVCRLAGMACEMLVGSGLILMRRLTGWNGHGLKIKRLTAWLVAGMFLLATGKAEAHQFGDDFGDSATNAYALTLNTPQTGCIEVDADQDWFSFPVSPLKMYTVTVSTGTIWDCDLSVTVTDGVTARGETNSIFVSPASVSFTNFAPPTMYYVKVSGFADFTTGTYSIVVHEAPIPDADGDGMADAWEILWFGNTNQSAGEDFDNDGLDNIDEYLLGTDPTDPDSTFRISSMSCNGGVVSLSFDAQPFRCYGLDSCTNLYSGTWQRVATITNLQSAGPRLMIQTNQSPCVFYRVRCLF